MILAGMLHWSCFTAWTYISVFPLRSIKKLMKGVNSLLQYKLSVSDNLASFVAIAR